MHIDNRLRGRGPLERKSGGSEPSLAEVANLVGGLAKTFEEFKSANDRRLKEIEKKGAADPVSTEKVDRIEGDLKKLSDELLDLGKKANRIPAGGETGQIGAMDTPEKREHRAAWNNWGRKGQGEYELRGLERKANTTLVPEDGGLLVPETVDAQILTVLRDESEVRTLFDAQSIGTTEYRKLVGLGGAGSGWVGETDARPATSGPKWTEISGVFGEIYADPQISQTLLDDSRIDLEAELATEVGREFGQKEGEAFLFGDGVKKPKGLFTAPMAATGDATRPFGTFQTFKTGVAATLPTTDPGDLLLDVIYGLKKGYRRSARWLLNGVTLSTIRKWKDKEGNYLWQPSLQAGEPGSLLGYPITDMAEMPDIAANAMPIAFGDFRRAYKILDRIGIRTLRDPYTNKPFVGFYSTKRVGGMILDSQSVKFVKVAA